MGGPYLISITFDPQEQEDKAYLLLGPGERQFLGSIPQAALDTAENPEVLYGEWMSEMHECARIVLGYRREAAGRHA